MARLRFDGGGAAGTRSTRLLTNLFRARSWSCVRCRSKRWKNLSKIGFGGGGNMRALERCRLLPLRLSPSSRARNCTGIDRNHASRTSSSTSPEITSNSSESHHPGRTRLLAQFCKLSMLGWYRSVSASLVVAAETTNTLLSFRFEGQENLLNQNANAWGRMERGRNRSCAGP